MSVPWVTPGDGVTIDRELGWAEDLGFNTARCFIQHIVNVGNMRMCIECAKVSVKPGAFVVIYLE